MYTLWKLSQVHIIIMIQNLSIMLAEVRGQPTDLQESVQSFYHVSRSHCHIDGSTLLNLMSFLPPPSLSHLKRHSLWGTGCPQTWRFIPFARGIGCTTRPSPEAVLRKVISPYYFPISLRYATKTAHCHVRNSQLAIPP